MSRCSRGVLAREREIRVVRGEGGWECSPLVSGRGRTGDVESRRSLEARRGLCDLAVMGLAARAGSLDSAIDDGSGERLWTREGTHNRRAQVEARRVGAAAPRCRHGYPRSSCRRAHKFSGAWCWLHSRRQKLLALVGSRWRNAVLWRVVEAAELRQTAFGAQGHRRVGVTSSASPAVGPTTSCTFGPHNRRRGSRENTHENIQVLRAKYHFGSSQLRARATHTRPQSRPRASAAAFAHQRLVHSLHPCQSAREVYARYLCQEWRLSTRKSRRRCAVGATSARRARSPPSRRSRRSRTSATRHSGPAARCRAG